MTDLRQKCDYREFVEVDESQAKEMLAHAQEFVSEAERTWKQMCQGGAP